MASVFDWVPGPEGSTYLRRSRRRSPVGIPRPEAAERKPPEPEGSSGFQHERYKALDRGVKTPTYPKRIQREVDQFSASSTRSFAANAPGSPDHPYSPPRNPPDIPQISRTLDRACDCAGSSTRPTGPSATRRVPSRSLHEKAAKPARRRATRRRFSVLLGRAVDTSSSASHRYQAPLRQSLQQLIGMDARTIQADMTFGRTERPNVLISSKS